jgi:hypothetical protein
VLLEPEIEYDHLIQVMDAIRTAEVPVAQATELQKADDSKPIRLALFTDIAVGDAP